ncbi:gliding motility-associated C-terminal domain-containing protein [Flavobacterium sp.]|uniref:gliding motility-associated C-terminal domain-containing protein n=1 Tax=Flavobacterium sp. TaxID=239 RepID=UPI00261369F1|nr:gliding motility-associated C-terminal domain-containing protein [Flavobacterium sp.]
MQKSIIFIFLYSCFVYGQNNNSEVKVNNDFDNPPFNIVKNNKVQDSSKIGVNMNVADCSYSVVPPAIVNGVFVTATFSGYVSTYPNQYSTCSGSVITPANSIWLGSFGSFNYTLDFDQPVNNLVIAMTGAGFESENFIFNTNGGVPSISSSLSCFSTIIGNTILSGAGSGVSDGGGGIFTITAPNNFTSITINGDGGSNGSLVSICSNSIVPLCNSGSIAPILSDTIFCGVDTVNLNSINATNLPSVTGVSLAWFTTATATNANQLTFAQAQSQPIGVTYYAAFYDSINNCYSPTTSLTVTLNPIITPSFSLPSQICKGQVISEFPTVSNEGIIGSWSPQINNTASATYTFTPNVGQCAVNTTFNLIVNLKPNVNIDYRCNGKDYELVAFSDVTSDVSYNWLDSNQVLVGTNSTLVVTEPGIYQLIVNNLGCQGESFYAAITIYCDIQKGISPNNNGFNDFFELSNLDVKKLSIFNRYGVKVYTRADYKNEWTGISEKGDELPDGVYYYVIDFKDDNSKTGWIYLNREK